MFVQWQINLDRWLNTILMKNDKEKYNYWFFTMIPIIYNMIESFSFNLLFKLVKVTPVQFQVWEWEKAHKQMCSNSDI